MKTETAFNEFLAARPRATATRIKYQSKLKLFLADYGRHSLRELTPEMVCHHFQRLERRGLAMATLASHRSAMVALFNYCLSRGWLRKNPATAVPRYSDSPAAIQYPEEGGVAAVLATARLWASEDDLQKRRDAAIVYLAAVSSRRRGELKNLRLSVALSALASPTSAGAYCLATWGKTGAATLVINEVAASILRSYLEMRPPTKHDSLWVATDPSKNLAPLGDNGFQHVRRRICSAAGVKLVTYQELRRWRGRIIGERYGPHVGAVAIGHRAGTSTFTRFYYNPAVELAISALIDTAP